MAVSSHPKTQHSWVVTFADGTGTPITLALSNDTSVNVDGLTGRALNELVKVQRRGKHFGVGYGPRVYPQVTIEFIHNGWEGNGTAPGTPLEFALFQNTYSANVSTSGSGTRSVKTIDIRIAAEGTDYGDSQDHAITLEDCMLTAHGLLSDGDPGTYSMTFDILGAITGDLAYAEA
jgi:hypothetical protein